MAGALCVMGTKIFGPMVPEEEYDPTMMSLTFGQIKTLRDNFGLLGSWLVGDDGEGKIFMFDGVLGDEPDGAIDWREALSYYVAALEEIQCADLPKLAANYGFFDPFLGNGNGGLGYPPFPGYPPLNV